MNLLLSCRKLVLGTTIDYGGVGAKPQGCSRGIHRHVSSTDDTALLPGVDRGEIVLAESLHKVVSRQELIGGENPVEILARNAHEFRQTGSRADEHGLVAFLVHQLVDGDRPSDNHIGLYFDSERLDSVDLALEDGVLRKPELRDAIFQHTAGLVEGFEDRDIVAFLGEVGGAGQACRSGTYDGNLRAARGRSGWRLDRIGAGRGRVVSHKPFQLSDGHRLTLDPEDAAALALALLRADTSADGRKGGVLGDDGGGSGDVTCGHLGDEFRNLHADRAGLHTAGILAMETACGLCRGFLKVVAVADLFEIMRAYLRILLAYRYSWYSLCHYIPILDLTSVSSGLYCPRRLMASSKSTS